MSSSKETSKGEKTNRNKEGHINKNNNYLDVPIRKEIDLSSSNPLLSPSCLPHSAVPFDKISAEHFLPALDHAIAEAKEKIKAFHALPGSPSFSNTIEFLETLGEKIEWISGVFYNLLGCHTHPQLQALAEEIGPRLANFSSDLLLDEKIFDRVKTVYLDHQQSEQNKKNGALSIEQKTLLENTYLDFTRNGALLNNQDKQKLRKIDEELSKLGPQFTDNVLKSTNHFSLHITDVKELSGLPESIQETAAETAKERNQSGWIFTLQAPSVVPFLKYADHRGHRETIWKAYNSRCNGGDFSNIELIKKIVRLRFQRAQLLGYKTHADFVLRKRMAESPQKVHAFLERLFQASKPAAQSELEKIAEFAKKWSGLNSLMPWDFSYYAEKYKKSLFAFDEEELRPYFQLEKVVKGVFDHARLLYGLYFEESKKYPVYHKDVKVFEVFKNSEEDPKKKDFIGLFYMDFFPRSSKRGGAWMTNYFEQGFHQNQMIRPHVAIVCNFTQPTGEKPSLLTFDEVETLFHEFGHALHSLLSRCHYRSLAGTNVYWDFVELPSQIMENWVREREGLSLFAFHYQTGEVLPEALTKKIKEASRFLAGYDSLRQLNFALLDMAWHDVDPNEIEDIARYEEMADSKSRLFPKIPGTLTSTSFSHIFGGGYSAGYYSYKWAEVLDADAFEYFQSEGIFNPKIAALFEEKILSKGGTDHPMKLYQSFRGREPDPDALLRRLGLI